MQFIAELRQVVSKKTTSGDREMKLVLVTEDSNVLALGALPSDKTVKVSIEANEAL